MDLTKIKENKMAAMFVYKWFQKMQKSSADNMTIRSYFIVYLEQMNIFCLNSPLTGISDVWMVLFIRHHYTLL